MPEDSYAKCRRSFRQTWPISFFVSFTFIPKPRYTLIHIQIIISLSPSLTLRHPHSYVNTTSWRINLVHTLILILIFILTPSRFNFFLILILTYQFRCHVRLPSFLRFTSILTPAQPHVSASPYLILVSSLVSIWLHLSSWVLPS